MKHTVLVIIQFLLFVNGFKKVQQQYYFDAKAVSGYVHFKASINRDRIEMTQVCGTWGSGFFKEISSIKEFDKDSLIIKINDQILKIANTPQTEYESTEGIGSFKFKSEEYLYIKQELISFSKVYGTTYLIFEKLGDKSKLVCRRDSDLKLRPEEMWKLLPKQACKIYNTARSSAVHLRQKEEKENSW